MFAKPFPFTQEHLLNHFDFEFSNGNIRKKGSMRLWFINKNKKGYLTGLFENKTYFAHRIIYFAHYNLQPIEIDHKDRNPANNSISNLIPTTRCCNNLNKCNQGIRQTSSGKYRASVHYMGKNVNLGTFNTLGEADLATYYFRLEHGLLNPQYLENMTG